jgi:putative transport protein
MHWLVQLFHGPSGVAHAVLILGLVASVGLAVGAIRIFKVNLGVAGVLFAGLAFGHFGITINHETIEFAREFGLILFVYTIGVQVGPGFLASLRRQGLPLNLMAAGIVLVGAATTIGIYLVGMEKKDLPVVVGLFAGATTNTPSLAAAQQALMDIVPAADTESLKLPGLGYAVAYPFGIVGIILAMVLTRTIFRIDTAKEADLLARLHDADIEPLATVNLEVTNPNLDGLPLSRVPTLDGSGVTISRIMHAGSTTVAKPDAVLHLGDVLLAVGPQNALEELRLVIGRESRLDLKSVPGRITTRRIVVTRSEMLGKSIGELRLPQRFGVTVTRVHRAEIELPAAGIRLQFADNLLVVGEADGIRQAAAELGDSPKRLNHPQIIPLFLGIALGVLVGSWPIYLPGMSSPVRLGLAGGPLLVAILLSRLGNIGSLVWYMPISANFLLREVGIVLFLACVGLKSGDRFVATLTEGHGLYWMACGVVITLLPLLLVAFFARLVYKLDYFSLCGLLAGSMTDPPALAFAGSLTGSEVPSIAYATVYPLVMLLRVLAAQGMVLVFFR